MSHFCLLKIFLTLQHWFFVIGPRLYNLSEEFRKQASATRTQQNSSQWQNFQMWLLQQSLWLETSSRSTRREGSFKFEAFRTLSFLPNFLQLQRPVQTSLPSSFRWRKDQDFRRKRRFFQKFEKGQTLPYKMLKMWSAFQKVVFETKPFENLWSRTCVSLPNMSSQMFHWKGPWEACQLHAQWG